MADSNTFSIGVASQILGVSVHALRKWELRYEAIKPARSSGGDRRYSEDDLERLARIKQLIDQGHTISALAPLSDAELLELANVHAYSPTASATPISVAVFGERLAQELGGESASMPGIEIVIRSTDEMSVPQQDVDVITLELGSLGRDTARSLQTVRTSTGVDRLIVVFGFGAGEAASRLADDWTAMVRRPVIPREFARTAHALSAAPSPLVPELGLPPHRFSRGVLAQMAMISPELACECPRHVGELLIVISDFEAYSAECEITKPEDAQIHNMLRRTAATSRALFEDALVELAAAEDIDIAAIERRIDADSQN